jgi:hypothetical protein
MPAPNATFVQALLDRVRTLSRIWSPYTAYVAVLTIIGIPALQFGRPESVVWMGSLLLLGISAPLIERLLKVLE